MAYIINTSTGVVTLAADGTQVAPAQSVTDPAYMTYIDWVNAGNTPTPYIPPVNTAVGTKVTVLAFRNRFTQAEKVTMDMASIDNPAGTMQQRQLAASLRVMATDLGVATFVDLARADLIVGVHSLETYGIIGAGRANTILTAPILDSEIPLVL
jgi:bifunctional pyridoxal-dependent enzyme with beta-cystathionase and maltose regulon repressor activities